MGKSRHISANEAMTMPISQTSVVRYNLLSMLSRGLALKWK